MGPKVRGSFILGASSLYHKELKFREHSFWGKKNEKFIEKTRQCTKQTIHVAGLFNYLAISGLYLEIWRRWKRIRRDMSSSSPPQPQNWLENPFSFLKMSKVLRFRSGCNRVIVVKSAKQCLEEILQYKKLPRRGGGGGGNKNKILLHCDALQNHHQWMSRGSILVHVSLERGRWGEGRVPKCIAVPNADTVCGKGLNRDRGSVATRLFFGIHVRTSKSTRTSNFAQSRSRSRRENFSSVRDPARSLSRPIILWFL